MHYLKYACVIAILVMCSSLLLTESNGKVTLTKGNGKATKNPVLKMDETKMGSIVLENRTLLLVHLHLELKYEYKQKDLEHVLAYSQKAPDTVVTFGVTSPNFSLKVWKGTLFEGAIMDVQNPLSYYSTWPLYDAWFIDRYTRGLAEQVVFQHQQDEVFEKIRREMLSHYAHVAIRCRHVDSYEQKVGLSFAKIPDEYKTVERFESKLAELIKLQKQAYNRAKAKDLVEKPFMEALSKLADKAANLDSDSEEYSRLMFKWLTGVSYFVRYKRDGFKAWQASTNR